MLVHHTFVQNVNDKVKHKIVLAVLIHNGHILLGHRSVHRSWYPNCWDIVGGHIEPGESAPAALRRECREELGVDITAFRAVPVELSDLEIEAEAFVVTEWSGEVFNAAPDEHDELQWFLPLELSHLKLADPVYKTWLPTLL